MKIDFIKDIEMKIIAKTRRKKMSRPLIKALSLVLVATMVLVMFTGCLGSATTSASNASDVRQDSAATTTDEKVYNITVIIKGEDSEFWQLVKMGAEAATEELGSKVNITYQSTVSSTDFDGQVALFQNVMTSHPDAIVVGPTNEGTAALFQQFMDDGSILIVWDNTYGFTNYTSFIRSDNLAVGAAAADAMIAALDAEGKPLTGSACIISAKAGVPTLNERDTGFADRMAEIAPDITLLPTRYAEGDPATGMAATQDTYLANQDTLVGLYGDANTTGNAIAQAVSESNLEGKFIVVATDSDAAELEALKAGTIHALFVQDTYEFGYLGVMNAYNALIGQPFEKDVTPQVHTVTLDNLNTPEIQRIIDIDYAG